MEVNLYGLYGYITSIIAVLIPLSYFGIQRVIIREIAKNKALTNVYMGAGLVLRGLLSIGFLGCVYFITQLVEFEHRAVVALYVFGVSEILLSFVSLMTSIFTAIEKMHYDTIFTAFSRILNLALIGLVVTFDLGFNGLFGAFLVGNLVSLGLVFKFTVDRIGWPEFEFSSSVFKFILKESFPVMLATFLSQAFFRVDIFVLKFFKSFSEVALFFGPHSLVLRLQVIPLTISIALFPSLSRIAEQSTESLSNVSEKALKILISISLPISAIAMVLADDFIVFFFGQGFAEAAIVFKILIWTINFMFVECLFGFILVSIGKQWFSVYSHFITLIINLVLDLILIPSYGIIGASVATLIAYGIRTTITYYFVSVRIRSISLRRIIFKPVLATIIAVGIFLWGSKVGSLYFSIAVALLFYFVTLWLSKSFSVKEIMALRKN